MLAKFYIPFFLIYRFSPTENPNKKTVFPNNMLVNTVPLQQ